ncbi:MAG: UDPGP type 1 family protein [Clostridia bacterium]|nr:UDPGP type 1 family protein [Clostridia bacterium]
MNTTKSELEALLAPYGQTQLLRFWDTLDDAGREKLAGQIKNIDFSLLKLLEKENHAVEKGELAPLGCMTLAEIAKQRDVCEEKGIEMIRQGKAAAVLLAGGQGTRLGSDGPKGTYNIGLTRDVFIFQRLIENLMDVTTKAGAWIPLLIMTSDKNHEETVRFLTEKKFFGYNPDYVIFFMQSMAPSVDYNGKILLEAPDSISLSPNGNGGWFASIQRAELLPKLKEMGVEYFNVFAVDNVLQRICDPCFLGATELGGYDGAAKVVRKNAPDERIGVLCLEDGMPSIVEYYEMTEEMTTLRDKDGELAYAFGVILNYLFRVDHLEEISSSKLPTHIVEKKIPYVDNDGTLIKPDSPNGYKFETLILDMVHLMNSCLSYEIVREHEFAPIKNKTGIDSVESARELLKGEGYTL